MKRPRQPLPAEVDAALDDAGVRNDYDARPDYQRNDYLRWSAQAATDGTRAKRIQQMISELRTGGVYMGMEHNPSKK